MLVRSKQSKRNDRRRHARGEHGAERVSAASALVPAEHVSAITPRAAAAREAGHGGPSQDRALYTCECGYAFHAPVTTSVGCPHCARTQAW